MVLNIRDNEVSQAEPDETSDRCGNSAQLYSDVNRVNNLKSNGSTFNKNGEGEVEVPLDFSIKREDEKISNQNGVCKQETGDNNRSNDDTAQLSPISSGSCSPRSHRSPELHSVIKNRQNGIKTNMNDNKAMLPGLLPMTSLANGMRFPMGFPGGIPAHLGMLGPLSPLVIDSKTSDGKHERNGKNGHSMKNFANEQLPFPMGYFGLPGVPPMPGLDMTKLHSLGNGSTDEMLKRYQDYLRTLQESQKLLQGNSLLAGMTSQFPKFNQSEENGRNSQTSPSHSRRGSDSPVEVCSPHSSLYSPTPSVNNHLNSEDNPNDFDAGRGLSNSGSSSRKRARTLPDDCKDAAYWERRRKNNEAAKRSRDARRAKEDQIAIRAAFLEQENLKLRIEVAALKTETSKLRCMLYNS